MKASEFRIGNLIYQGETFGEVAMNSYDLFNYQNFELNKPSAHYCEQWKPILLTQERLVEFGFKGDKLYFSHNAVAFTVVKNGTEWLILLSGRSDTITLTSIRYVHQLQNLYFLVSAKELLPTD